MISIIPTPKICNIKEDVSIDVKKSIYTMDDSLRNECELFSADFKKLSDLELAFEEGGIELRYDDSIRCDGYTIDVSCDGILLSASGKEGIMYALSSLTQMLTVTNDLVTCPQVHIEDYPDKEYRSLMVDLGRQWHPAHTIYKYIDVCYMYKVKYLHLHFCDTRLYTIPSKAFPKINKTGKFYSEEDIKAINVYAKKRGIVLVPEFECPGHAPILVDNYPEVFGNDFSGELDESALYNEAGIKISTNSLVCAGSDRCFDGIKTLIKEICDLFPDAPYINIGGDEANIALWKSCSDCKKYMKDNVNYCKLNGYVKPTSLVRVTINDNDPVTLNTYAGY